jgi:hypothetical protein
MMFWAPKPTPMAIAPEMKANAPSGTFSMPRAVKNRTASTATQSTRLINCTWLASLPPFNRRRESHRINQPATTSATAMVSDATTTWPMVIEASPSLKISDCMNIAIDSTSKSPLDL